MSRENGFGVHIQTIFTMEIYRPVHNTDLHYAKILKRNKVIASCRNSIGTRSRGCGYSDQSIHAERAVVKRLGDVSQLDGCVLLVIRVNKQGELRNSKPCRDCQKFLEKCMREYGLRKVVYS
jgi:hypothetical protein